MARTFSYWHSVSPIRCRSSITHFCGAFERNQNSYLITSLCPLNRILQTAKKIDLQTRIKLHGKKKLQKNENGFADCRLLSMVWLYRESFFFSLSLNSPFIYADLILKPFNMVKKNTKFQPLSLKRTNKNVI